MSSTTQVAKEHTLTMAIEVLQATLNSALTHPTQATASLLNGIRVRSAGWLTIILSIDARSGIRRQSRTFQWRCMSIFGLLVPANLPGESTIDGSQQPQWYDRSLSRRILVSPHPAR